MIAFILGMITLLKVDSYKRKKRFADARMAGTLGTVNLVFAILELLPMLFVVLMLLMAIGELITEADGNIDEIIITIFSGGIILTPSAAIVIFGFVSSSKGRKLWKSVNTVGSPDYIPIADRNTTNSSYNQNRYAQNQNTYNYSYSENRGNNSGFYNSSGLYGNAAQQSPYTNASGKDIRKDVQPSQNTDYNNNTHSTDTVLPKPRDFSSSNTVLTSVADNNCDYGRTETGYIPHPETTDEHCATHSVDSFGKKKWKCPSCNKSNKAEETFCRNCGTNRTATF